MTRKLVIDKKTGFRITQRETPVIVRDCRGLLFYSTELQVPNVREFNLPCGEYLVDSGYFTPMSEPVDYPLKSLPPFERDRPLPKDFVLTWGDNPNKCSIIWPAKTILFDRSLEEYRLPELFFILYHEYGHSKYKTEKFCDLYAYNCLIRKGFNPEQVGLSQIDSLSAGQWKRKAFLTNVIINRKFDRK